MKTGIISRGVPVTERTYTTFEVARLCGVFPSTVIYWVKKKKLPAFTTPGGHRRVLHEDLAAFMERYRFPGTAVVNRSGRRVLIVEDDEAVGQMLQRGLQKSLQGTQLSWVKNGIEALLSVGQEPPDLVVLDVTMPVMDGAKVLATLRADPRTKSVKVIGVTGKRLPPDKLRYMRRHTDAFFFKPFDIWELSAMAQSLMGLPTHSAKK